MKQITSDEFKQFIELDPAWASKLTEPVEITDYCNMTISNITHLSPLLIFSGRDQDGDVASFHGCKSLKVAEGIFHGGVELSGSSIQKIGKLIISQPNKYGYAVYFAGCSYLKIAEGKFNGLACFAVSGIEKIGNLIITLPSNNGIAANFYGCNSLKQISDNFPTSTQNCFKNGKIIGKVARSLFKQYEKTKLKNAQLKQLGNEFEI